MAHFDNILLAIDFSDGSQKATNAAIELAGKTGAHLHMLSVHDIPVIAAYADAGVDLPAAGGVKDAFDSTREAQRFRLTELRDQTIAKGVEATAHLGEGEPAAAILETAERLKVDLVVMGTHGRTGLQRFLIGSVAERVLRTAVCPVFIVPLFDPDDDVAEAS